MKIKISKAMFWALLILVVVAICGTITFENSVAPVWSNILLMFVIYFFMFSIVASSTTKGSVLCDYRFYIITLITLYSTVAPLYCILSYPITGTVRVRTAYTANTYTLNELRLSTVAGLLFIIGMFIGLYLRARFNAKAQNVPYRGNDLQQETEEPNLFWWVVLCIITVFIFIEPYLNGGFSIIQSGGTVLDINTSTSNIVDIFFSSEIMVVSSVALVFYLFQTNVSVRVKMVVLAVVVIIACVLALFTTRRARAVSILLCCFAIYLSWYIDRKGVFPRRQVLIFLLSIVFLYFLEIITSVKSFSTSTGLAGVLSLFDGITAYDSILLAVREGPQPEIWSNIIYGIFRPIPILGKYIVSLFGINPSQPPLYSWMAARYSTYQYGGGLAYLPQLEAYLCGGFITCPIFGFVYGLIFGKERHDFVNLMFIAISFSVARGTLQVFLKLLWPYYIIGYLFYDRLIIGKVLPKLRFK